MGALDCAWIITKEDRYSDEGTLNVTGRDMESQKLKDTFLINVHFSGSMLAQRKM